MKRPSAIATCTPAPVPARVARKGTGAPAFFTRPARIAMLVPLAAMVLATGCERRPFQDFNRQGVTRCINHVCPITGQVLGSRAFAVPYRGHMIGVHDRAASDAWKRLPEWQQQAILHDLTEHAAEW